MKIFIINSGSSSLKYQLFDMPAEQVLCSGLVERIGIDGSKITYKYNGEKLEWTGDIPDHKVGLEKVLKYLTDAKVGVINSKSEIDVVGHRVVHGGSTLTHSMLIDDNVKKEIESLYALAPLHNPSNLQGINVAEQIFSQAKQVAVFDTSFHQTMPVEAYKYAIPNKFLTENNIRKFGFHGTSHKYVAEQATEYLQKEKLNLITIHLGNGCSMSAVKNGKSIDTSLGFGAAAGLVMGTRSGDIDLSVVLYLIDSLGYTATEVNNLLFKQSGMQGLTGFSDLRDIEDRAANGDKQCQEALELNAYRIKQYIGSYIASMNGLDAIVFTAGIGENSDVIRKLVCSNMDYFGIELDEEKNNVRAREITEIHKKDSKVKILIIPTNEELEIAKDAYKIVTT